LCYINTLTYLLTYNQSRATDHTHRVNAANQLQTHVCLT